MSSSVSASQTDALLEVEHHSSFVYTANNFFLVILSTFFFQVFENAKVVVGLLSLQKLLRCGVNGFGSLFAFASRVA
ncbi:hypothetical protein Tco_0667372 [Tanacetum coccineum]|uniref:Uncharacterized protein n=1 Tax=Tanacetum coccineum TaxID=301880 RepID=A0ABQ5J0T4_9ASTR